MHLMYYMSEAGERIYTLKVCGRRPPIRTAAGRACPAMAPLRIWHTPSWRKETPDTRRPVAPAQGAHPAAPVLPAHL